MSGQPLALMSDVRVEAGICCSCTNS